MKNNLVVIRVDGNTKIGLGHVYRGIALAEMLKDNFDIEFVTDYKSTTSPIKQAGFRYNHIPPEKNRHEETEWIASVYSRKSLIILDGYEFSFEYQKQLKQYGFKLIFIDDLKKGKMIADIVINHCPNTAVAEYISEKHTQFALGTDYALLRPSFLESAGQAGSLKPINTAFVCFGGSDKYNLTTTTLQVLLQISQLNKINIVIGSANQHYEIFKLQEKHPEISIHQNLNETELLKVMIDSNFAVVPASTILFELCAVRMPIAAGYYVKNQMYVYKGFEESQAIYPLGDFRKLSSNSLLKKLQDMIENYNLEKQLRKQEKLIDGKIKERYIKLIASLWN